MKPRQHKPTPPPMHSATLMAKKPVRPASWATSPWLPTALKNATPPSTSWQILFPPACGHRNTEAHMAKSLQEQLLAAGLVDKKKAKKAAKELKMQDHLQRTGQANEIEDRKSTRLNSSHGKISYAVVCLKKK